MELFKVNNIKIKVNKKQRLVIKKEKRIILMKSCIAKYSFIPSLFSLALQVNQNLKMAYKLTLSVDKRNKLILLST